MFTSFRRESIRLSIGRFKRNCTVCQSNRRRLDQSYSKQSTLCSIIDNSILRIDSGLQTRSRMLQNTIRYASSTKDTTQKKPIQKPKKVTTLSIASKKRRGEKITMVTAYDFPSAVHVDRAGVDILLVGDSCAMVELGFETTQVCLCVCQFNTSFQPLHISLQEILILHYVAWMFSLKKANNLGSNDSPLSSSETWCTQQTSSHRRHAFWIV